MNKLITSKYEHDFNIQLKQACEDGWIATMQHTVTSVVRESNSVDTIFAVMLWKADPPKQQPKPDVSPAMERVMAHRHKQINEKGYTIKSDVLHNADGQLTVAARILSREVITISNRKVTPKGWDRKIWEQMMGKAYTERLVIASSLLCDEADRRLANAAAKFVKASE